MGKLKLKLHIGTEKTGSSFLQTLLALNREQLQDLKIYYPQAGNRERDMVAGRVSPGNGKNLYLALKEERRKDVCSMLGTYKEKAQEIGCDVILISNENLIEPLSDENNFNQFIKCCSELNIEWSDLLLVLRDPVGQALSLYKHRSKNGKAALLRDWLENGYTLPKFLNDFLSLRDHKKVKFTFRKYQNEGDSMQQILFEDWLQIGMPRKKFNQRVNPSLTISELLLLKKIAAKNEKWISPFYEKMLAIPFKEKGKEDKLSGYYRKLIANKLVGFQDVWSKCNDYMSDGDKLDLPIENDIKANETEVLNFSIKQTEQIIDFLSEVNTKQVFVKNLLKRIKRKFG